MGACVLGGGLNGYGAFPRELLPIPPPSGAAVSVLSFGKPRQSQNLQTWSFGLVSRPRTCASCLRLCTTATASLTPWHIVGTAVAATARG